MLFSFKNTLVLCTSDSWNAWYYQKAFKKPKNKKLKKALNTSEDLLRYFNFSKNCGLCGR